MADDEDLDALLEEAADDVLNAQDAEDMLDEALDDILGGELQPRMDTSPKRSAPPKSEKERLQDCLAAVLPADAASRWAKVIEEDEARMASAPCPRPHSRAYRSLNSRGQASGNKREEEKAVGQGSGEHNAVPASARAINELLLRAAHKAGIKDTEPLRKALAADTSTMKRLQELFMRQMLVDLKEVVAEDADFDRQRFPCTAQRVLGMTEGQA